MSSLWLGVMLSLLSADILTTCQDDPGYYSPRAEYDKLCNPCLDGELIACRCDSNCNLRGELCCNLRNQSSVSRRVEDASPLDDLLKCRSIHLDERTQPDWGESFWMVSACPTDWLPAVGDDRQQKLDILVNCSRGGDNFTPVTDLQTGLVYKNKYCAKCHKIQNIKEWGYTFACSLAQLWRLVLQPNFQLTSDIVQRWCLACRFRDPHQENRAVPEGRPCVHSSLVISSCLEQNYLTALTKVPISEQLYEELKIQCQNGPFSPVASELSPVNKPFRNQYCVLCNGIRVSNTTLTCANPYQDVYRDNTNHCHIEAAKTKGTNLSSINSTLNNSLLCNEFLDLLNNSDFIQLNSQFVIEIVGFSNRSGDICTDSSQNGTFEPNNMTITFYSSYPIALTVLTYACCSLSVIGCVFVLITYSLFKDLRTLPGKILMNLCAAIMATALFILVRILVYTLAASTEFCQTTAIFLHWLVISQFSWMTVMSCELARTMIRASRLRQTQTGGIKQNIFVTYLLVGWGIPTLLTGLSVILNYTTDYIQYGQSSFCWIGDSNSFYAVFIAPVALSLLLNGAAFFVTTYLLVKAQRGEAKLQKQHSTSYLRIHLSVFSITGLTWVFGFVAILSKQEWAWYIFIIFTYTQGFTICAAFLFTQKVFSLYKERVWSKISSKFGTLKQSMQDTLLAVVRGNNASTESATIEIGATNYSPRTKREEIHK